MPSLNYSSRGEQQPIAIIVHAMGTSLDKAIRLLTAVEKPLSAHYLVPQLTMRELCTLYPSVTNTEIKHPDKVPVIAMVSEGNKAFHAGVSCWKDWNLLPGCSNSLNNCSIGIEFHSPGYALGNNSDMFQFAPYTDLQIETGAALIKDISDKWGILGTNILAHSDVSPLRLGAFSQTMQPSDMFKTDPGPLFPWKKLYQEYNVGYYPLCNKKPMTGFNNDVKYVQDKLRLIGYACPQSGVLDIKTQYCINAYRMHFMHDIWTCFDGSVSDHLLKHLYYHL